MSDFSDENDGTDDDKLTAKRGKMPQINTLDYKIEPSPTHPFKVCGYFMRGIRTTRYFVHLADAQAAQKECFGEPGTLENLDVPELLTKRLVPLGHYTRTMGELGHVLTVMVHVTIGGKLQTRELTFDGLAVNNLTPVEIKLGAVMTPKLV